MKFERREGAAKDSKGPEEVSSKSFVRLGPRAIFLTAFLIDDQNLVCFRNLSLLWISD